MVDNRPLRREIERELQVVREALEECEEEIARHERLDLPAFRQWIAVQCSDLLNERRAIEEKIWGLRGRLAAIQGLTQHGIRNVAAAFFWLHEIEQDRRAIPPYVRRAWDEVTIGPMGKQREHGVESGRFDEGPIDEAADDDDCFVDRGEGAGNRISGEASDRSEQEQIEEGEGSRHKSLYRKIALLLHPDLAGMLTQQELELWYQAQRSYAEKDVVSLEIILARCDRVGTNSLILSELRAFVRQAHSRLATLQASISGLAGLPSWRFLLLNSPELNVRLQEVRRELECVIRGLKGEASMMENELARIEETAKRWVTRRKGAERQLALDF